MRAYAIDRYGGLDELRLREIDDPVVLDNDLLVRVRAAALNPADWKVLTGQGGGTLAGVSDFCVAVPSTETDLIQERHLVLLHILAEVVERVLTAQT